VVFQFRLAVSGFRSSPVDAFAQQNHFAHFPSRFRSPCRFDPVACGLPNLRPFPRQRRPFLRFFLPSMVLRRPFLCAVLSREPRPSPRVYQQFDFHRTGLATNTAYACRRFRDLFHRPGFAVRVRTCVVACADCQLLPVTMRVCRPKAASRLRTVAYRASSISVPSLGFLPSEPVPSRSRTPFRFAVPFFAFGRFAAAVAPFNGRFRFTARIGWPLVERFRKQVPPSFIPRRQRLQVLHTNVAPFSAFCQRLSRVTGL